MIGSSTDAVPPSSRRMCRTWRSRPRIEPRLSHHISSSGPGWSGPRAPFAHYIQEAYQYSSSVVVSSRFSTFIPVRVSRALRHMVMILSPNQQMMNSTPQVILTSKDAALAQTQSFGRRLASDNTQHEPGGVVVVRPFASSAQHLPTCSSTSSTMAVTRSECPRLVRGRNRFISAIIDSAVPHRLDTLGRERAELQRWFSQPVVLRQVRSRPVEPTTISKD